MFGDVNLTDALEGLAYPTPDIYPDENNTDENSDTGMVVYEYMHRDDLVNYADMNGFNFQSALGITEDNLYHCARKYLMAHYGSPDITLSKPKFSKEDFYSRIIIRYTVNLS